jgi:hypothetical protein
MDEEVFPHIAIATKVPGRVYQEIKRFAEEKGISQGFLLRAALGLLRIEGYLDREDAKKAIYILSAEILPSKDKNSHIISTSMSESVFRKLEEIRKKIGVSRSRLLKAGIALLLKKGLNNLSIEELEKYKEGLYSPFLKSPNIIGTTIPDEAYQKIKSFSERNKVSIALILRAALGLLIREGYLNKEGEDARKAIHLLSVELAPPIYGGMYHNLTVNIKETAFKRLGEIAKKAGTSRSEMLRAGIALLLRRLDKIAVNELEEFENELYSLK